MKSAILSVTKFPTLSLCYMAVLISSSPQESTFPNRIKKRISRRIPAYDGMFLLCYGDETPGSVKPSGEHDSCFGGGSSEWFAQGNVQAWAGLAGHYFFFSELLSPDVPLTCCVSCSAHTAFSRMLCATRPTGLNRHMHSLAVCSSQRKPRNCLWEYPRKLHCRKF